MAPLALVTIFPPGWVLQHCLGLPFWHYQFVLSWWLVSSSARVTSVFFFWKFQQGVFVRDTGTHNRTCISDAVFLEILSHLLEYLLVKSVEMNYQCIGRMHLEANFLVQANFAFYTPAPALPAQNLQLLFLNLMPLHSRICVSSKRVRCWLQAMGIFSYWSFWELKPSIWGSRGWDSKYCWGPHIFIGCGYIIGVNWLVVLMDRRMMHPMWQVYKVTGSHPNGEYLKHKLSQQWFTGDFSRIAKCLAFTFLPVESCEKLFC